MLVKKGLSHLFSVVKNIEKGWGEQIFKTRNKLHIFKCVI